MMKIAIIAGAGRLPAALAQALTALTTPPLICALEGFLPEGLVPDIQFRVERLMPFLRSLSDQGVTRVIFRRGQPPEAGPVAV